MKYSDELKVEGKVALVTGAARGIGRACALALAEGGADIALGLRDVNLHNNVAKEIEALGRRVLPLQLDVSKSSTVSWCISRTKWISWSKFSRNDDKPQLQQREGFSV